ncbi:MAG: hypothetical protein IID32_11625 [Planctomycetes bacterium]|nr:hypothetical protein [Planctomycetota bacterium]
MTKQETRFKELLSHYYLRELLKLYNAFLQHKVTRRNSQDEPNRDSLMWHLGRIESLAQLKKHFPNELADTPRAVVRAWDDGSLTQDQALRILNLTIKNRRRFNAAEEKVRKAVLIQLAKRIDRDR